MTIKCLGRIPFASLFAAVLAIFGCVVFCVQFDRALMGFSMQVHFSASPMIESLEANTLLPVGEMSLRTFLIVLGTVVCLAVAVFLLIGVSVTAGACLLHHSLDAIAFTIQ
jgi:hypothetical protein